MEDRLRTMIDKFAVGLLVGQYLSFVDALAAAADIVPPGIDVEVPVVVIRIPCRS